MDTRSTPPPQDTEAKIPLVDWPEGVPQWEPYLCWQTGRTEPEAIEALKTLAAEEFEARHGKEPEHVFYYLRAVYAGPVSR